MAMTVQDGFNSLAAALPGFEERKEQRQLTEFMSQCLNLRMHGVAQAPTGTGKSFAVILALLTVLKDSGKTAVIATANNNLLEQYANKDLPFAVKIFPWLKWARAKGKANYLCLDKYDENFGQTKLFSEKATSLTQWVETTTDGDRDNLPAGLEIDAKTWNQMNADEDCTGKKCPFYSDCHFYRAKADREDAQIVVTNFDIVLLNEEYPMAKLLPHYDYLILDEAHNFPEKAIDKFAATLTKSQAENFSVRAVKQFGLPEDIQAVRIYRNACANFFNHVMNAGTDGEKVALPVTEDFKLLAGQFIGAIAGLDAALKVHFQSDNEKLKHRFKNFRNSLATALKTVDSSINFSKFDVPTVERNRGVVTLMVQPFRVSGLLQQRFFSTPKDRTVITLSATLGTKQATPAAPAFLNIPPAPMFTEFRTEAGIAQAIEFNCPSPFDYKKNAVLYLPDAPVENPNTNEWKIWAYNEIVKLVELSQGRALILCTSTSACKTIAEHLGRMTKLPVKAQTGPISKAKLVEWFLATDNAVLVATASFWEGISIEGDDLKLVIIDRIPFSPHTDPIHQAREAFYKADPALAKKAFYYLSVFPAIIRLLQGFGRLIRTKRDTGAVAILDPRITKKHYGKQILNALPPAQRVVTIDDPRLAAALKVS